MADVIKTTETLNFDCLFVDEDTRIITVKNPKESITTAQIDGLNTFMQANNIIVGDKEGATFGRIKKVTRVTKLETALDLAE